MMHAPYDRTHRRSGNGHPFVRALFNVFDITDDMQTSAQASYNELARIIGAMQRMERAEGRTGGATEGTATSGGPPPAEKRQSAKEEPTCSGTNSVNEPTTQPTSSTVVTQPRRRARHHKAMHHFQECDAVAANRRLHHTRWHRTKKAILAGPTHRQVQLPKPTAARRVRKGPRVYIVQRVPRPGPDTPTSKRAAPERKVADKVDATPQQQLTRQQGAR